MPFDIGGFIFNGDRIENDARAGIVTDGLVLHLDVGINESYPKSGSTWYDISGNGNHFTLYNGVGIQGSGLGDGKLNYTLFDNDNASPTTTAGMDTYFASGSNIQTGLHDGAIAWGSDGQTIRWGGTVSGYPAYHTRREYYGWKVEGYIYLPEDGTYNFLIDGDDAIDLFIDGILCSYWYGGHGFGTGAVGTSQTFSQGWYTFTARMQEFAGGDGIAVGWQKPSDGSYSTIPGNAFSSFLPSFTKDVMYFDGVDDLVTINSTDDLNLGKGNFTIEVWLYGNIAMDTSTLYHDILQMPGQFDFGVWRSGLYPGSFYNTFGGVVMFGTDGVTDYSGAYYKHTGRWTHVVFTREGSTMYFYLNGQEWATKTTPALADQANSLRIGKYEGAGYSYDGFIPRFNFYNRALSATEITQNFNAQRARFGV